MLREDNTLQIPLQKSQKRYSGGHKHLDADTEKFRTQEDGTYTPPHGVKYTTFQ